MDKLLTCNPRDRLTAAQALEHDYFWTDPLPADPRTWASALSSVFYMFAIVTHLASFFMARFVRSGTSAALSELHNVAVVWTLVCLPTRHRMSSTSVGDAATHQWDYKALHSIWTGLPGNYLCR